MKSVKRAQLRAGRYKQHAEIWRFTPVGSDAYGQPINAWKLHKKIRCFIDGTAGQEWFAGDMIIGKETFYFDDTIKTNKELLELVKNYELNEYIV